jgi:hypothetical protein
VLSLAARFQPDAGPLIPMPRCETPKRKRPRARSTMPWFFHVVCDQLVDGIADDSQPLPDCHVD